ncbi:MAG: potassium channel family protein [Candidatus Micrarchaeota archaeon]
MAKSSKNKIVAEGHEFIQHPSRPDQVFGNVLLALAFIILIHILWAFFFHNVENWSYLDSVYFVTVTITTIGYGDHVPQTDIGKMGTIVLAWVGISTAFFLLYSIMDYRKKTIDAILKQKLNVFKRIISAKRKRN